VITQHRDDPTLQAAVATGFARYVSTDGDVSDVVAAIRALRDGHDPSERSVVTPLMKRSPAPHGVETGMLTAREVEVLRLLAQGASNRQIANQLLISVNTARNHVQRLLPKLDAHTRGQAVAIAFRTGLIEDRRSELPHALTR
jgi:DNA-binding NarL/FixJ family response regulator